MENKIESKKIALIITFTIFLIVIIGIIFATNLNKDTSIDIEATVKYVSSDYLIATTSNNEEYRLEVKEDFKEGDKILVNIDNINKKTEPIEAEVKSVKLLSRSVTFTINDPVDNKINNEESSDNSSTNNQTTNTNNNEDTEIKTEEDVVRYIETINNEIDNNNTISEKVKSGFITIVDFIFYDSPIGGHTFSSLSTTAKLKVLKIALSIDEKIENKFPNYKENLSEKYQNIKSKVIAKYLDITTEVCANNEDTCASAKEGLSDLKENFNITWTFIKDIAGTGISKLKSWYEVWRTT